MPQEPNIIKLRDLVRRLRAPEGCPWDRRQTLGDLRAYLIEEAHETAAAITAGDMPELQGELGDLLFQVVFVCALAEEENAFDLDDVINAIHDKMVRRHPHVFGPSENQADDADAVVVAWEKQKLAEKAARGEKESLLDGVPSSLPALVGAYRMTQKAAGVGFDWPDVSGVLAKVHEELGELEEHLSPDAEKEEIPDAKSADAIREEVGDLLFSVANLARHLKIDPEAALAEGNLKFRRRFAAVEQGLAQRGRRLADADLEEMDALWNAAKERSKENPNDR